MAAALDTLRSRPTPEGVELGLRVAGPVVRLLAWLLDAMVLVGLILAASTGFAVLGRTGSGLLALVIFALNWFYPVLFEVYWRGATPGKRMMGLQVVHDDGTPVRFVSSLIRNLVRFADWLPALYGFGLVSVLLHRDFKRLGDLAAGTLVVHAAPDRMGASVPAAPPLPAPFAFDLAEQRAVIDFGERQGSWSRSRAAELAELLEPATGARGAPGVQRLLGLANWFLGRR